MKTTHPFSSLLLTGMFVAAACGKSSSSDSGSGIIVNIHIANRQFLPAQTVISPGTAVLWTNNDTTAHTITDLANTFNSGTIRQGEKFTYTFDNKGTYNYTCTLHPGMQGKIIVQ